MQSIKASFLICTGHYMTAVSPIMSVGLHVCLASRKLGSVLKRRIRKEKVSYVSYLTVNWWQLSGGDSSVHIGLWQNGNCPFPLLNDLVCLIVRIGPKEESLRHYVPSNVLKCWF